MKLKKGDRISWEGYTLEVLSVGKKKVIATNGDIQLHILIKEVTKLN